MGKVGCAKSRNEKYLRPHGFNLFTISEIS